MSTTLPKITLLKFRSMEDAQRDTQTLIHSVLRRISEIEKAQHPALTSGRTTTTKLF